MMPQQATGMVPPNQQQQPLQYQQPLQPQWMMQPPQQGFQPQQPPVWGQQQPPQAAVPTPQQAQYPMMQMQQQQQYLAAQQSPGEVKSLWIGDLQYWMDETYLYNIFGITGEVTGVKIIKNKQTQQPEGYGFIEFTSRAAAERSLLTYNNTLMPNSEQNFRLNWATLGAGERRQDEGPDYTIFVGDLAADVTDYILQETFKLHYPSVKGAKVVIDRNSGRTKGYGFVRFSDESEQVRAMTEMNGALCSTRPMRIGPAATKKPVVGGQQYQKATFPNSQGAPGETDPNNTTIFVGGLDESVTDDQLRQAFGLYGELVHVKIPVGKRCGFVQFSQRANAEVALQQLNGTQLGGQSIRLSWGRSTSNKQAQPDQSQWNAAAPYYGYSQGYESYGFAPPQPDASMYYAAYPNGYGSYQQQPQTQPQQQ